MRVTIYENPSLKEDFAEIHCRLVSGDIRFIAEFIQNTGQQVTGKQDGSEILLSAMQILYFESVDGKTFACLEKEVYETDLRLKEIEEHFSGLGFVRISKSVVVNLYKIRSVRNDFEMRVLICLDNQETLVINRHYRHAFRKGLAAIKERTLREYEAYH